MRARPLLAFLVFLLAGCGTYSPGAGVSTTRAPSTTLIFSTTTLPATSTTTPYDRIAGQPPEGSTIAVVGCSNTWQHAVGYTELSAEDHLRFGPLGVFGNTLRSWSDANNKVWNVYENLAPDGGYDGVWLQICMYASEHVGQSAETGQANLRNVVEQIRTRSGDIPIYLSPINSWGQDAACNLVGEGDTEVVVALADWGAANLDEVHRGPDTGPVPAEYLQPSGCHLTNEGEHLVGAQLIEFFDQ